MRIISGSHKGKRLSAPKNLPVRPTTDFAKEALFNILRFQFELDQVSVLDLYAGTGNISFEFASRGTPDITAVDSHRGCTVYIQKVSEELGFPIRTVRLDALKYLETTKKPYDLVFADPPYSFSAGQLEQLVAKCLENDLLLPQGRMIVEHSKHVDLGEVPNFLEARRYGGSVFSFFGTKE